MKNYEEHLNELVATYPKNDYVRVAEKVKKDRKRYAIEYAIGSIFVLGFFAFAIYIEPIVEMMF